MSDEAKKKLEENLRKILSDALGREPNRYQLEHLFERALDIIEEAEEMDGYFSKKSLQKEEE